MKIPVLLAMILCTTQMRCSQPETTETDSQLAGCLFTAAALGGTQALHILRDNKQPNHPDQKKGRLLNLSLVAGLIAIDTCVNAKLTYITYTSGGAIAAVELANVGYQLVKQSFPDKPATPKSKYVKSRPKTPLEGATGCTNCTSSRPVETVYVSCGHAFHKSCAKYGLTGTFHCWCPNCDQKKWNDKKMKFTLPCDHERCKSGTLVKK